MAEKVFYGKIENIGGTIKEIGFDNSNRIAIITDSNVAGLYLSACRESLEAEGYRVSSHITPPGETNKNGENYLKLLEEIAAIPLGRTDMILALGGGVVGDLAGFVAATYMRGIKLVQVPTTLLSMVDSSVGGKTGINLSAGKNLAGAFHLPEMTFIDEGTLSTLPNQNLRDGMAEVVKYGVLGDEELFRMVSHMVKESKEHGGDGLEILRGKTEESNQELRKIISRCIDMKTSIVERDLRDQGERNLLNLGHTFGHAIEKLSNYQISHGFAVAKGLSYISHFSQEKGWSKAGTAERIDGLLLDLGFDINTPYSYGELLQTILKDKKRKRNSITLVVPEEIGKAVLKEIALV